MRILLVSDTHRRTERLKELVERMGKIDALFHMGDSEQSQEIIECIAGCPVYIVRGNCDYNPDLPQELLVNLCGHKFFITHGHRYGVDYELESLKNAAREHGADIACFGHTHRGIIDNSGDVTAVNPGSLTNPRPYGSEPTYILLEIDDNDEVHFHLNMF